MEKIIFKISCLTYLISAIVLIYLILNPNMELRPEILSYIQWWNSHPTTALEGFISNVTLDAIILSLLGVTALFFHKKWGAYLFVPSILFLVSTEWLAPNYPPSSNVERNLDTVISISIGFILCFLIFSEKLNTFKYNKSFKPTPKSGAA